MRRLLLVLALVLAPPAGAANVATPKMEQVASWAAGGRPIQVWCEDSDADWARMLESVGLSDAGGYTYYYDRPEIFLSPVVCYGLSSKAPALFGPALNTLLHEAYTHYGAGVYIEAMQECGAKALIYEALRKFWGVQFFTPRMRELVQAALDFSHRKPPAYQRTC